MNAPLPLRRPRQLLINADNPFENDKLNRAGFAQSLTSLINSIEPPFVINLNAPWGCGKSTFLEMWEHLIRNDHCVIRINAWENDYSGTPLVAIALSLAEHVEKMRGFEEDLTRDTTERMAKLLNAIFMCALAAGGKALSFGLIDIKEIKKALDESSQPAKNQVESKVSDFVDSMKRAKKYVRELVEIARDGLSPEKLLIIVVDELDRCRPDYALGMLEAIKHLFLIEGVCFVLATDREQLEGSVKTIYGLETPASEYLRKFIDLNIDLPKVATSDFVEAASVQFGVASLIEWRAQGSIDKGLRQPFFHPEESKAEHNISILKQLLGNRSHSLRTIEQSILHFSAVIRSISVENIVSPTVIAILACLRHSDNPPSVDLLFEMTRGYADYASKINEIFRLLKISSPEYSAARNRSHALIEPAMMFATIPADQFDNVVDEQWKYNRGHDYVLRFNTAIEIRRNVDRSRILPFQTLVNVVWSFAHI